MAAALQIVTSLTTATAARHVSLFARWLPFPIMQVIEHPSLADHVQKLTAGGTVRDRRIYRLIDRFAADEASAALRGVASRVREAALASAFSSAALLLGDADDDAASDRLRGAL